MTTRRTAVGALTVAVTGAALGMAGCVGSGDGRSQVRSLRIFPGTTVVAADAQVSETSTTTAAVTVPTSTVTGAVAAPTTAPTTTAPTSSGSVPTKATVTTVRPPTTVRPRAVQASTTTTSVARPAGVVEEHSDNGYAFVYNDGASPKASGSATTIDRGTAPRRLQFAVSGGMDHDAIAKFEVTIINTSGRQLSFPGGLDVRWVVQRNGAPWKTVHLTRPEITGLSAGGNLSGSAQAILDQFGEYTFTGNVAVQYR